MNISDQRLREILDHLDQGDEISGIAREEWASIARELRQLRLRTSAQSRGAFAAEGDHA